MVDNVQNVAGAVAENVQGAVVEGRVNPSSAARTVKTAGMFLGSVVGVVGKTVVNTVGTVAEGVGQGVHYARESKKVKETEERNQSTTTTT